jgi:HEAT repeat protein
MKNMNLFAIFILLAAGFAQTKPVNLETGTDPHPQLVNAKVQTLDASSGLRPVVDNLVKQAGPLWIGYVIPTERKERTMCCFDNWDGGRINGCCSGCKLENREGNFSIGRMDGSNCNLEPADYAFVFLRAEGGKITKTRAFSRDCALDAAGLNVYWLTSVKAPESVALLSGIVRSDEIDPDKGKRIGSQAVFAIAIHNDPSVDAALESFLAPSMPDKIRREAAMWLGAERGEKGLVILRKAIKNDPDEGFREHALFGFAQAENNTGLKDLLDLGKTDPSTRVRGQAIFWLAQAGSRKVGEEITAVIENDPDTDVKKKAVFALSQMPHEEGVPLLINVAKTNKNPVVRKQAIFWLGQTHDPRALDFLEEILFAGKKN